MRPEEPGLPQTSTLQEVRGTAASLLHACNSRSIMDLYTIPVSIAPMQGSAVLLAMLVLFGACASLPDGGDAGQPAQARSTGDPEAGVVWGAVRDEGGGPVAGVGVFVALRRVADPREPGACENVGAPGSTGMLALARTVTDERGEFRQPLPAAEPDDRPNCVVVFAELRRDDAADGEYAVASAPMQGAPLPAGDLRVDLALQRSPAEARGPRFRTPDQQWAELTRGAVPGFAGFFLEGCTVVVNLTDPPRQQAAASAYLTEFLRDRQFSAREGPCPQPPPMEFRQVRFDFDQLHRWSSRAAVLLSLERAVFHGIEENRNRIVFGFEDEAGRRRAERALATLDVPREAVVIEAPVEPVRLMN
jgi:hypothetical protein